MPKKLKTFSFSDTAERNLSLLMSDLEIHSASELIPDRRRVRSSWAYKKGRNV